MSSPIEGGRVSIKLPLRRRSTSFVRNRIESGMVIKLFLERSRSVRLRRKPISGGITHRSLQQLL